MVYTINYMEEKKSLSEIGYIDEDNILPIKPSYIKQHIGNPLVKSHTTEMKQSHYYSVTVAHSYGDISELETMRSHEHRKDKIISKIIIEKPQIEDSLVLESQLGLLEDGILDEFDQMKKIFALDRPLTTGLAKPIKPILCLDLDETLIHSIVGYNGNKIKITRSHEYVSGFFVNENYVMLRPWLHSFLREMKKYYELYVFTASHVSYAAPIIKLIEENEHYFAKVLFRDSCVIMQNIYVKDLDILKIDLSRIVILDNSVLSFSLQLDNGIHIKSFNGSIYDSELYNYCNILQEISMKDDVRVPIKNEFNLQNLFNYYKEVY